MEVRYTAGGIITTIALIVLILVAGYGLHALRVWNYLLKTDDIANQKASQQFVETTRQYKESLDSVTKALKKRR